MKFIADGVQVRGPRQSDGSFTISFTTGEYQADKVAELLKIRRDIALNVSVEMYEVNKGVNEVEQMLKNDKEDK